MKKFGLLIVGGIAAIVFLANLGPLIGLAITVAIAYLVIREFMKAKTTGARIAWGLIAFIIVCITLSNIPSLLAVVAAFVLYWVFKKWNDSKVVESSSDPFANFEREWANLNK